MASGYTAVAYMSRDVYGLRRTDVGDDNVGVRGDSIPSPKALDDDLHVASPTDRVLGVVVLVEIVAELLCQDERRKNAQCRGGAEAEWGERDDRALA